MNCNLPASYAHGISQARIPVALARVAYLALSFLVKCKQKNAYLKMC